MNLPKSTKNKTESSAQEKAQSEMKIRGFTISFRTMPDDMKRLSPKEKTPAKSAVFNAAALQKEPAPAVETRPEPKPLYVEAKPMPSSDLDSASKPAQISEKKQIALFYKNAKSFYKKGLFQEAIVGLQDVLKKDPNHWRASWFLKRSQNKLLKQKEKNKETQIQAQQIPVQKESKEIIPATMPLPAPLAPAEAEKTLLAEKELLAEKVKKETEEKMRQEIEQKALLEEQKIKELEQKIASEEAMIETEQKARQQLAQKLETTQQEKQRLEAQLETERQSAVAELAKAKTIAALGKPEMPATIAEKPILEEKPPILPEQFPAPVSAPEEKPLETAMPLASLRQKSKFALLFSSKPIKIIFSLIVFAAIAAAGIYGIGIWQNDQKEEPTIPVASNEILPPSLLPINKTETITIQTGQKKNFANALKLILDKEETPGAITRVLVKLVDESQNQKYLTLGESADLLQIVFPTDVLQSLGNNYTIFVYSQKELPLSPFAAGLGRNKIGLAVSISQKEKISQLMSFWEQGMEKDLDALFMGKKISFSQEAQWSDISYLNYQIRSLFLPDEHSSLNYAFVNGNLFITTSLETMKTIIDRIAPSQ